MNEKKKEKYIENFQKILLMSANSGGLSEKEHGDGGPTNQPARSCRW